MASVFNAPDAILAKAKQARAYLKANQLDKDVTVFMDYSPTTKRMRIKLYGYGVRKVFNHLKELGFRWVDPERCLGATVYINEHGAIMPEAKSVEGKPSDDRSAAARGTPKRVERPYCPHCGHYL